SDRPRRGRAARPPGRVSRNRGPRRRRRARLEGDRYVLRAAQGGPSARGGGIVTRAAVVGCGIMGSGITFVARAAGFPVTAVEPTDELLAAARERVERHEIGRASCRGRGWSAGCAA